MLAGLVYSCLWEQFGLEAPKTALPCPVPELQPKQSHVKITCTARSRQLAALAVAILSLAPCSGCSLAGLAHSGAPVLDARQRTSDTEMVTAI